ncbi:MAG: O-antigen ligase family protein [Bacteroidaceae bacterium]|nr:O-antigen ligase family protein [Bacteroidaceae bacterium]
MYKTISRVVSVALLLICVYQSYIALVQWQWHFFSLTWAFRVSGTFLRSTELALLLAFMLPWLCYSSLCLLRWKSSNWIDRLLSLIIFASLPLPILALIATCCRAAWMAALSGCVLVVCLFLMKQSGKICIQRRHAILFIIGLSLVYTFVYFFKKDSADGRQLIWKVTVWQMTHHPKGLLMGYGSFSSFYGEAQETYFRTKERPIREQYLAGAPDYAYNEYLQLLVEHGLMVFGVIMIVLLQLLRELWRNCNKDSLPLFCCVISFLMAALFSYPFHLFAPCFLSVTLILLAIYNCYENHFEKGRW